MPLVPTSAYGPIALAFLAGALVVAVLLVGVKLSLLSRRRDEVRVYDFAADLHLPKSPPSYRFALYLTLKSLPREPAQARGVTSAATR